MIGARCKFAHAPNELRYVPQEEKLRFGLITWQTYLSHRTQPCQNLISIGECPYGNKCCFRHDLAANEVYNPTKQSEEERLRQLLCYSYSVHGR